MKTIKIPKQMRRDIRLVSIEGETVDDTIKRLLPKANRRESISGRTNIRISDETYSKLKRIKGDDETLVRTLERVIDSNK